MSSKEVLFQVLNDEELLNEVVYDFFCEIDTDNSGLIERGELMNFM
jgi:hypothetical protein